MGHTLIEIAENIKGATHTKPAVHARTLDVKAQLIYAFNGTGKTRLSRVFKEMISDDEISVEEQEQNEFFEKILYYNAFTEDLFYWNNDELKLKIQNNLFTYWILKDEGQDQNIISNFQRYTNDKLTPQFDEKFSEIQFSFKRGNEDQTENVKISKGEESCFIWSVFYALLAQVIDVLNVDELSDRSTDKFNELEWVFIDDPVSSLDENHLIELAVDIAKLIRKSRSNLKFVITTHNPLFYNVLHNELRDERCKKHILKALADGTFVLENQPHDSPFSYHLFLKTEISKAIDSGQLSKYHFNFLRNILEKTSTFLGHQNWGELLPEKTPGERDAYLSRIINLSSHSKNSADEVFEITENDKRVLGYLMHNTKIFEFFKS